MFLSFIEEVQSSFRHFTQQPQSIMWHLQCQETCWMATNTINLSDEGAMQGCDGKCKGTKSIQNLCPLLLQLWFNAFSLCNQIHNSQLLLVCPNNVWPVRQGIKLEAHALASWGNQQQAEHPMRIAHIIYLHCNQGWCKRHINGRRF